MATALRRFAIATGNGLAWYALPAVLVFAFAQAFVTGVGIDFDANVWLPAKAVLHGQSPYPQPELSALVGHATFMYPPVALWIGVPLSVLPHDVARGLFWVLGAGAVVAALRVAGVRDRRVLVAALVSVPVWLGELYGNPTLLLVLPLALAWRERDRPWAVGLWVGLIVAFKLILWPLGLWLLVTRRLRAASIAVGSAIVMTAGTWAAIGFDGLSTYPKLLHLFSAKSAGPRGLTISTLTNHLGLSAGFGQIAQWLCGAALLGLMVIVVGREEGDRRAFSLAIVATLLMTPVVWIWYLALLLVPLALARPAFSPPWQVVMGLWVIVFLPRGPMQTVTDHGRVLHSLGYIPTVPQLLLALGFIGFVAVVVAGPKGLRLRLPIGGAASRSAHVARRHQVA
jgi:hypothetical protein